MDSRKSPVVRPLRPYERRIVARFAEIACPPGLRAAGLTESLLGEFESALEVLQPALRRAILIGLLAFDQGARIRPASRGRRFSRLPDASAESYLRALLGRRGSRLAVALQRIKGLVVMCYYELPEVADQVGFRPEPYIAAVSQRRLDTYGAAIRAGEAAVLAPDELVPDESGQS